MSGEPCVVVFADVDTLLTNPASLPREVESVLQLVKTDRWPLVLCSTRTRAELEFVQQSLGFRHPFICENGAAVYVPSGYFELDLPAARASGAYQVVQFGRPYAEVVDELRRIACRVGVEVVGFHDLSIEEVATECQLPLLQARLAKVREYGEPFRIVGGSADARRRLFKSLRARGLGCAPGAQYDYVGAPVDEGVGIDLLCKMYRLAFGSVLTIGIGDPARDVRLLESVEIPMVAPMGRAELTAPRIMKVATARFGGSADGRRWADALLRLLRLVRRRMHLSGLTHGGWA